MKTLANRTILTLTTMGLSAIASGLDINELAIGTSTDEPSESDTALQKEAARYPALATTANGKTQIRSVIEYGSLIGIHEIGLYSKGELLATINKEINRADNNALILAKYKNIYLLDIEIDNAEKSIKLSVDERNDINYMVAAALLKLNINSGSGGNALMDAPTRVGQVLTSKVINGKLVAAWDDLANVPQYSDEFEVDGDIGGDIGGDLGGDLGGDNGSNPAILTDLINARYVWTENENNPNNYLENLGYASGYGGYVNTDRNFFVFRFDPSNASVVFNTSTGNHVTFTNNRDGTLTINHTRGSGEVVNSTITLDDNTIFSIFNQPSSDVILSVFNEGRDINILSNDYLEGGLKLTGILITGNAPTIFYTPPVF